MLETMLIIIRAVYLISEMHQMAIKYLRLYEKFIFSVNRKPIFYGLITNYVTELLLWTIF